VTVVTTLEALTAAVVGDSPKIVVISGTITGNVAVLIGSNTSIFGRSGSKYFLHFNLIADKIAYRSF